MQEDHIKPLAHIPQGRAGRIYQSMDDIAFRGLYTDGFISCSIIVCIGKRNGRISLAHADQFYYLKEIAEEMQWVGEDCEFIILHHPRGMMQLEWYKKRFGDKISRIHALADQCYGVSVSFTPSAENKLHPLIAIYNKDQLPRDIVRHPDERNFMTGHHIE
ncbi:MAG: hypothetical protein M3R00_08225, partial [Pseudomonadota bacterium]|nr:hypothetical protein [Pseudomonadota bacterium]